MYLVDEDKQKSSTALAISVTPEQQSDIYVLI